MNTNNQGELRIVAIDRATNQPWLWQGSNGRFYRLNNHNNLIETDNEGRPMQQQIHNNQYNAYNLIKTDMPGIEFVKHIADKSYYADSSQLGQEIDLELFMHIVKINKEPYLAISRGKHRIDKIDNPEEDEDTEDNDSDTDNDNGEVDDNTNETDDGDEEPTTSDDEMDIDTDNTEDTN